jgi:trigger factor
LEISLRHLESGESELTLIAQLADLKPFYDKTLSEVQKGAEIKGFRKGKAPKPMIEKLYRGQIEVDSQIDFINFQFGEYTKEKNIPVLSQPNLKDIKKTEDGNIRFVVLFESLSDFNLGDYKDFKVFEPTHAVTDEETENEIYKLVRANGTFEDADQVNDYDYIVGLQLLDKEHNDDSHVPEEQTTNVYLNDEKVDPQLKQILLNGKVGDSFDYESGHGDHSHHFKITINDIQKLIPAEFNNELVEKLTNGKFVTTEDLRENIGYDLQEQWDRQSRIAIEEQIIEQLVERTEMVIPDSLNQRTCIDLFNLDYQKQNMTFDKLDNQMKNAVILMYQSKAETFIKWNRIRDKIIEKETILVEDYDLQKYVDEEVEKTNLDADKVRAKLYLDDDFIFEMKAKKLMDLLIDFAVTNEVTFEEYKNLKAQSNLNSDGEMTEIDEEVNQNGFVDMTDKIDDLKLND